LPFRGVELDSRGGESGDVGRRGGGGKRWEEEEEGQCCRGLRLGGWGGPAEEKERGQIAAGQGAIGVGGHRCWFHSGNPLARVRLGRQDGRGDDLCCFLFGPSEKARRAFRRRRSTMCNSYSFPTGRSTGPWNLIVGGTRKTKKRRAGASRLEPWPVEKTDGKSRSSVGRREPGKGESKRRLGPFFDSETRLGESLGGGSPRMD